MTFEELARKYSNFYVPSYKVLIDGDDILKKYLVEITDVTFEDMLEGSDTFSININDPATAWLDKGLFEPGKQVEIKMGYVDKLVTMIIGEIISLKPSFPADGTPKLTVSGYDLSNQFTRIRKHRSYKDMRDSDVIGMIISEAKHKLSTQIESTDTVHPRIDKDRQQTDFDFIKRRAEMNFFEFGVKERTFYFRKTRKNRNAIMSLNYGSSLLSFSPELNTANQPSEVSVRGWNPGTKKEIIGRAKRGSEEARARGGKSGGQIVENIYGTVEECILDRPVFNQQEADSLASSQLNKLSEGLIKGNAQCIGLPEIRAGENIELSGLGKKFSKKYYIERTTHTVSSSGYSTTFDVKENTI
jgi:phage protein D